MAKQESREPNKDGGNGQLAIPLITDLGGATSDPAARGPLSSSVYDYTQVGATSLGELSNLGKAREAREALLVKVRDALTTDPKFAGKYDVTTLEHIDAGGQGLIFKVLLRGNLNKFVAIKVPDPSVSTNAAFIERFLREAKTLSSISHDNLVRVNDSQVTEKERLPYTEMDLLNGDNLLQKLAETTTRPNWKLGEGRDLISYFLQVCSAVEALHQNGIIHRDLKPENVMLHAGKRGLVAKVIDLGVGKEIGEVEVANTDQLPVQETHLTQLGRAVGTFEYMAPEQKGGVVTEKSDIYGLGGILCSILTRRTTAGYLASPSSRYSIPVELKAILDKCIAEKPEARYSSAREVSADVERWLKGAEVHAYRESLSYVSYVNYKIGRGFTYVREGVVKHPVVTALGLASVFGVAGIAKITYDQNKSQRAEAQRRVEEEERLASVIEEAQTTVAEVIKLTEQDRVGEAIKEISDDRLEDLLSVKNDHRADHLYQELQQRKEELERLLQLREVTVIEQEKRINSFELGEFAPFDVEAFKKAYRVYLEDGLTEDSVEKFVRYMKKSYYTNEHKQEIVGALGEALALEHVYSFYRFGDRGSQIDEAFAGSGLSQLDLMDRLLMESHPSESAYETPRFITVCRQRLLNASGRMDEAAALLEQAQSGAESWPALSNYPTNQYLFERDKRINNVSSSPNDSILDEACHIGKLIFAVEFTLHQYEVEEAPELKKLRLAELVYVFSLGNKFLSDNIYWQAQFGRASLKLAQSQVLIDSNSRSLVTGRPTASDAFIKVLAIAQTKNIILDDALRFDAAKAFLLDRKKHGMALSILNDLKPRYSDNHEFAILHNYCLASLYQNVDLEFASNLQRQPDNWQKMPIESAFIFWNAACQARSQKQFWERATEDSLNHILSIEPNNTGLVDSIRNRLQQMEDKYRGSIY